MIIVTVIFVEWGTERNNDDDQYVRQTRMLRHLEVFWVL